MQLVQLQRNLEQIKACGGQVVGISTDSVERLKRFADSQSITFHLLSDPGGKTIDAYDFRSTSAPQEWGVSRHGTFILDQKGVIRAKLFQLSYNEGPAVEALVKALTEARSTNEGGKP
jgi:peroxiredoxin Q/BCP